MYQTGVYTRISFFLVCINNLQFISDVFDATMFADDTIFFTHTKTLMLCFSKEITNFIKSINGLFLLSSHSVSKQNNKIFFFFHKRSKKDDIPLSLSKPKINNYEIKRVESIKFLGVLLDKNLTLPEI